MEQSIEPPAAPPEAAETSPAPPPAEPPKKVRREFSPQALAAYERKYKEDLARAPEDGVVRVDSNTAIVAAKLLGKSKKDWGVRGLRAREQLGQYLNQPIKLRPLLAVSTMDSIEQIQSVMAAGAKIANGIPLDPENKTVIRAEDRAKAITAVALAAQAHVDLSNHLLKLSDKGGVDDGSQQPPQNKPPSFGAEFVSPDGTKTRIAATSGG